MTTMDLINSIELLLRSHEPSAAHHWHIATHRRQLKIFPDGLAPPDATILATLDRKDLTKGPNDATWATLQSRITKAQREGQL